jgi:proteasome accessory factor A
VDAIGLRIPTAVARHFKEGVFLANGAAVWFEAERPSAGGGLVEGATPECHGPRELITYQRALDQLLSSATDAGQVRLIKNDRDYRDNIYGAQENYEVTLAQGFRLLLWRIGLVLLFPFAFATWLGMLFCVIGTLAYFAFAGLAYLLLRGLAGHRESLALLLFGRDLVEGRETCIHVPVWLESTLQIVTRVVTAPLAGALYVLLRWTAFCRVRRQLLPFLVSRPILAGAGMVDAQGRFHVADKGPAINCVLGYGGMLFDRPIFTVGHFFKAIYAEAWFSPREYAGLFAKRQRLQIGLGDSNMCETSEYLRVGTTLLVLDAIEAGAFRYCPQLRHPIRALHTICGDTSLRSGVRLWGELPVTALQIQRYYYTVCRDFLRQQQDVPPDAWEVLELWERALGGLQELADRGEPPVSLIGSIDWVTKKYLMDRAAADGTWSERKKIDIRYHEMSPEGYFEMLKTSGGTVSIVDDGDLDRALRNPPAESPATMRGHYIREFSQGDVSLGVNWKTVTLGRGWGAKVIRLAGNRYAGRGRRSRSRPSRQLDAGQ